MWTKSVLGRRNRKNKGSEVPDTLKKRRPVRDSRGTGSIEGD